MGYIFLTVYPIQTPKKDFFHMSIFTTILLTLIPLATHFSNVWDSMLSVAMVLSGVSRAYVLIPNMIMLHYFDVHQILARILINFFAALSILGYVFAIIFVSILISIGISWKIGFLFNLAIFFLFSLFLTLTADEVVMKKRENQNQKGNTQ